MRRRNHSPVALEDVARASALIENAQALLAGIGSPIVSAHLQHALDLLRGEPRLTGGSPAARRIDHGFELLVGNPPDPVSRGPLAPDEER